MRKNELFKPVERVTSSGIRITFTSKKELDAYDDSLRQMLAEKRRKEAENDYKNEVVFTPDFS